MDLNYNLTFKTNYRVGYHAGFDELFLFTIQGDGLIAVFRRGRLDSMFFEEFMTLEAPWFELGDL